MLALLFRGVFLVCVIGWYSASLWETVDSYFKSQFQRYLEEEYQRNPRMRDDVRAYATTADKAASDLIAQAQQQQQQQQSCAADEQVCPIDKSDLLGEEVKSPRDESVPADFDAGAAEIEVARPAHTGKPAFQDSPVDEAEPPPAELHEEMPKPPAIRSHEIDETSIPSEIGQTAVKIEVPEQKQERVEKGEAKKEKNQSTQQSKEKRRAKKRPKIEAKSELAAKRKIKRREKIPTLKLTDDDFEEVARFFEFDYEDSNQGFADNFENDDEDSVGIPIADLPFKPVIDVYDLERVSEEEFCPLSLDDDPTCDELRSWP